MNWKLLEKWKIDFQWEKENKMFKEKWREGEDELHLFV